jgi:hypothetical protein
VVFGRWVLRRSIAALAIALGIGAQSAESFTPDFVEETEVTRDLFPSRLCFDFAGLFTKSAETGSKLSRDATTLARQNNRITTSYFSRFALPCLNHFGTFKN